MSNSDAILEFLEENPRGRYCDACIAARAGVRPGRQVNTICNRLSRRGTLLRAEGSCTSCRGSKIINVLAPAASAPRRHARTRAKAPAGTRARAASAGAGTLGIEEMRTGIVRMCQELCRQSRIEMAPNDGPAGIIALLKDEQLIPRHQANMMHTICNLRNVYVWEQVELGPDELAIAAAAWRIILAWWEKVR